MTSPDFRFLPDIQEFFLAFMASIVIFGNNDIKNFWLPLSLGSILTTATAVTAAVAVAAATVKFSALAPAIAATFV